MSQARRLWERRSPGSTSGVTRATPTCLRRARPGSGLRLTAVGDLVSNTAPAARPGGPSPPTPPRVRRSRAPAARSRHLTLGHCRRQIRAGQRAVPRPSWRQQTVTSRTRVSCAAGGWTGAVAENRPACHNSEMSPGEPKIVRGHCPSCSSGCKAYVRGEHAVHSTDPDDGISARDVGMVLECCGCERIYFRRDFWLSEWEGVETSYWPAPVRRQRPTWLEKIEASERNLGMLLDETQRSGRAGGRR